MMEGNETAQHLVMYLGLCIFICIALVQLKDLLLQKAEVFIGKVTPSVQAASASLLFTLALLNLPWLSPKPARAKGISSAGRGWDVSTHLAPLVFSPRCRREKVHGRCQLTIHQ